MFLFGAAFFQRRNHLFLHLIDVSLLLSQTLMGNLNVSLEELELRDIQVAVFSLLKQLGLLLLGTLLAPRDLILELLFSPLLILVVNASVCTGSLSFEHAVNHVLKAARCRFFLHFGPVLHNRILHLDSQLVPSQCLLVVLQVTFVVVVEDVVQCQGQEWLVKCLLYLCSSLLQVLSSILDISHLIVRKREARNVGSADKVCISVISDHKRVMVDDCASSEPLNHKVLVVTSTIIFNGHFNNSLLDEEHFVCLLVLLTHKRALLKRVPFHSVNDLLLSRQRQISEVADLVHFNVDEHTDLILILEDLLLEHWGELLKRFSQLLIVRLFQHGQCAIIFRFNSCSALAIKYEADLAEMVPINQILGLNSVIVVFFANVRWSQVLRLDVHREFSVTDEVHECLWFFRLFFSIIFITAEAWIWVRAGLILLLDVNHIGRSKSAPKSDNE